MSKIELGELADFKFQKFGDDFFGKFPKEFDKAIEKMKDQLKEHLNKLPNNEDGSVSLFFEIPGIKEPEVSIEYINNLITVRAERKTINYQKSYNYSSFIPQGFTADNAKAKLEDGLLTITLFPEAKSTLEPKKIKIT